MFTFTKFGSCVVSDTFNFLDISHLYPLHQHTAVNMINMIDESYLDIRDEDIFADNNYWFRMQKYIFNHPAFEEYLATLSSDYFIFDLADERLPLQVWQKNGGEIACPVTWQTYNTSINARKNDNVTISDWHWSDKYINKYDQALLKFADAIKAQYSPSHIIYLSVRLTEDCIDKGNNCIKRIDTFKCDAKTPAYRKKQNAIIQYAENSILNQLPEIWVIPFPENAPSDSEHHFDPHPLHFNHIVYEYYSGCVEMIVNAIEGQLTEKQLEKVRASIIMRKKYAEIKIRELRTLYR